MDWQPEAAVRGLAHAYQPALPARRLSHHHWPRDLLRVPRAPGCDSTGSCSSRWVRTAPRRPPSFCGSDRESNWIYKRILANRSTLPTKLIEAIGGLSRPALWSAGWATASCRPCTGIGEVLGLGIVRARSGAGPAAGAAAASRGGAGRRHLRNDMLALYDASPSEWRGARAADARAADRAMITGARPASPSSRSVGIFEG